MLDIDDRCHVVDRSGVDLPTDVDDRALSGAGGPSVRPIWPGNGSGIAGSGTSGFGGTTGSGSGTMGGGTVGSVMPRAYPLRRQLMQAPGGLECLLRVCPAPNTPTGVGGDHDRAMPAAVTVTRPESGQHHNL